MQITVKTKIIKQKKIRPKIRKYKIEKIPNILFCKYKESALLCLLPINPKYYKVLNVEIIEQNYLYTSVEITLEKLQNLKSYYDKK